jgi:hypothetical protein
MAPWSDAILKIDKLEKVGVNFFKLIYAQNGCAAGDIAALSRHSK